MTSLKDLTLFAQGGQAEIYLYGDNKVLKVLRNPEDEEHLLNEIEIMKAFNRQRPFRSDRIFKMAYSESS